MIVDRLRQGVGRSRVVAIGHSWGGALGLLYAHAHPEKIAAVIAVAPVVDMLAQQQAQYAFVSTQATQRKDRQVLERLHSIGPPPHRSADDALAAERLADRYDAVFDVRPNRIWVMFDGMLRGLVTPWEIPRFIRGNNVSLAAMNDELLGLHLADIVPSLDVPVFFFLGRYDHHVDAETAAQYLDALGCDMALDACAGAPCEAALSAWDVQPTHNANRQSHGIAVPI